MSTIDDVLAGRAKWCVVTGDCLDVLRTIPAGSAQCCVTSPPYFGLRDYGCDGQIGLESTPEAFVAKLVAVFRDVRRVLRDDGTLWLNLGDSYNAYNGNRGVSKGENKNHHEYMPSLDTGHGLTVKSLENKQLFGIPWRVAFALQADGWYLRQDIIWHKPNPMPESVTDRCTKAHEYIFLFSKKERYHFDSQAMQEPALTGWNGSTFDGERDLAVRPTTGRQPRFGGNKYGNSDDPKHATKSGNEYEPTGTRNRRSVWTVPTKPFKGAHFATFPPKLIEPCVLAGCPEGGTVLDPFNGAGTTGTVAAKHGRQYVGIEINAEYVTLARRRITEAANHLFAGGPA